MPVITQRIQLSEPTAQINSITVMIPQNTADVSVNFDGGSRWGAIIFCYPVPSRPRPRVDDAKQARHRRRAVKPAGKEPYTLPIDELLSAHRFPSADSDESALVPRPAR